MEYHLPVLAKRSIEELAIKSDGVYVDATFGGGGHSRLILEQLGPDGRLFCFDQDPDARENLWEDERLTFFPANFRYIERFLRIEGVTKVDGILADLGVSSHQFDTAVVDQFWRSCRPVLCLQFICFPVAHRFYRSCRPVHSVNRKSIRLTKAHSVNRRSVLYDHEMII